jgi:hypothetical protein
MLNMECRDWVENALDFWLNVKPAKGRSRKLIAWNIEMLSLALDQIMKKEGATA